MDILQNPPITREELASPNDAVKIGFKRPGDGASTRTLYDKVLETVSVTDYAGRPGSPAVR